MGERRPRPADGGGWVAARQLRALAADFRTGWRALPAGAARRWLATLLAGYAAVFLLTLALVVGVARLERSGALAWETPYLRAFEARVPLSYSHAIWVQTIGTDLTLLIIVFFFAALLVRAARPLEALSLSLSLLVMDVTTRLGWALSGRARPTVIMGGISAPDFASFPSGHTAKCLAIYGLLALFWARHSPSRAERALAATLPLALTLLVAAGRVRMGVHWPSDVVGGAVIGGAWLAVTALALERGVGAKEKPGVERTPG
jgi:undecaprenyl-diphosphatase